jgi:flagellar capping protein FliD
MAQIQLPGLATGIDTSAIIKQLMAVNRLRLTAMQTSLEEERTVSSALGDLDSKLSAFKSASNSLSSASQLQSYSTSSSDSDAVSASANYSAVEGSHTVQVKQLASSDRWVQDGFKRATSLVGAGTFIISYNHEELIIDTNDETTLQDLVGKINNAVDNPGIAASMLKYDAGGDQVYHLVLSGEQSGSDYQIGINSTNTEVHTAAAELLASTDNAKLSTKIYSLDDFDNASADGGEKITIGGTDHLGGGINDVVLFINADTTIGDLIDDINEAFEGIATAKLDDGKIKLVADTSGASAMSITLDYSGTAAWTSVPAIARTTEGGTVDADVALLGTSTFLQTQVAKDSLIRVDDYPPKTAEEQNMTNSAATTGGDYTLTHDGVTTAAILHDADETAIQLALTTAGITGISVASSTPGSGLDVAATLTFTFADSMGDASMITIDTTNLTEPADTTHTIAEDTSNWISRSTNTVDDVISGVTLNLHEKTLNEDGINYDNIDIGLNRDTSALKDKVEQLITAYNDIRAFAKENASYDPETKETGALYGTSMIRTVLSELKSPFSAVANGFTSNDSFIIPDDIGIEVKADGTVSLNASEFEDALTEDYLGVLSLIGATKTGTSTGTNSADIKFYGASKYTDAGEYDIQVIYDGAGDISSVLVKEATEDWANARDIDISDDNITVDGATTTITIDHGTTNPSNYPEHMLQFDIPTSRISETLEATIHLKQGFAGDLYDKVADMLKSNNGRMTIARKAVRSRIDNTEDRIESEEARLVKVEDRLILKYARLETTLQMLKSQMAGLGM